MTRRRPGRRAARREEAGRREGASRREERAAAPARPHYGDVERRLAEEVLYLHSLWRAGPPAPVPHPRGESLAAHVLDPRDGALAAHLLHPGGGSLATHVRADRRKRRRLERRAEPEDAGPDWPAPSSPASPPPRSWPEASSSSPTQQPPPPQQQQPSPASLAQRPALRAAEEFFSGNASEGDDNDDEEGSESEDAGESAAAFFVGLFERDAELRGYYERSYEEGEFVCMGCAGRKARRGRARRFRDCISLVQHARAATRCGRRRAHRALASTVCRVLGWDIDRLPSIVRDPRGTLGQALLAREGESAAAAATAHVDAGENAGSPSDGDAAKENVGSGMYSSSSDEEEDDDIGMDDGSLSDGVAAKDDVDAIKSGPSSNVNGGEVREQENGIVSAEKEYTNDIDQLSSKDTTKEISEAVQVVSTDNGIVSAEKEDTNDIDQLSSKDTPKEISEAVQEGEDAVNNKQEHAKSADDMGCTSNVRLENSLSKEGAAAENKDKDISNVGGTGDDDIGSLGNSSMDPSKS